MSAAPAWALESRRLMLLERHLGRRSLSSCSLSTPSGRSQRIRRRLRAPHPRPAMKLCGKPGKVPVIAIPQLLHRRGEAAVVHVVARVHRHVDRAQRRSRRSGGRRTARSVPAHAVRLVAGRDLKVAGKRRDVHRGCGGRTALAAAAGYGPRSSVATTTTTYGGALKGSVRRKSRVRGIISEIALPGRHAEPPRSGR